MSRVLFANIKADIVRSLKSCAEWNEHFGDALLEQIDRSEYLERGRLWRVALAAVLADKPIRAAGKRGRKP